MVRVELLGHSFAGTSAFLVALWWTYSIARRYYLSKLVNNGYYRYRNTASYVVPCCPNRPIEGYVKITLGFIGTMTEVISSYYYYGEMRSQGSQHSLVYVFWILSGIVDVTGYNRPSLVPRHLDHMALALSFWVNYVILANHMHGKEALENTVHGFLEPIQITAVMATLAEIALPTLPIPAFIRSTAIMLSGMWMIHLSFILYPLSEVMTYSDDHESLMMVTALYLLDYAIAFFILLLTMMWAHVRVQKMINTHGKSVDLQQLDPGLMTAYDECSDSDSKLCKHP